MIRQELIGMIAALALASFSGLRAGTESSSPKAKIETACGCCGASCACPACFCDAKAATQAGCDCCGGAACCSAKASKLG
jgi:hypothetical protein